MRSVEALRALLGTKAAAAGAAGAAAADDDEDDDAAADDAAAAADDIDNDEPATSALGAMATPPPAWATVLRKTGCGIPRRRGLINPPADTAPNVRLAGDQLAPDEAASHGSMRGAQVRQVLARARRRKAGPHGFIVRNNRVAIHNIAILKYTSSPAPCEWLRALQAAPCTPHPYR